MENQENIRFIKYPSIEQFRTVVKNVQHQAAYSGQDDVDEPIYDFLKPKPTITVNATEKIHGTNAAVSYHRGDFWVQLRNNVITTENDNAQCARTAHDNRDEWVALIIELAQEHQINTDDFIITVFFEWAGGSIQKNSALSGLEKHAIIFQHFRVTPRIDEDDTKSVWLETRFVDVNMNQEEWISNKEVNILNIMNFVTYDFTIDFEKPEDAQNLFLKCIEAIEHESPVGKQLGKTENIGEGIVIAFLYNNKRHVFKVKGEKHSNSKVKTLKPVDTEKLAKVDKCVDEITHDWRFEQGLTEVFGSDYENVIDRSKLGEYLKWVATDTLKEETDVIESYEFTAKDVMGKVQKKAKDYFFAVEQL